MLDLIGEIKQTFRSNRLRTFLTGISVSWGVFMLILLLGVARGVINGFEGRVGGDNSNVIDVYGGRTSMPYHGYRDGRLIELRSDDRDAILRENGHNVTAVYPYASDTASIVGTRDRSNGIVAVYPASLPSGNVRIIAGRTLNERDLEQCRRVMYICEESARRLFGDAEGAVGQVARCMGLAWSIVGVYDHPWEHQNYIPYTTYKAVTGGDENVYVLKVEVDGIVTQQEAEIVEDGIRGTMARIHEFHPADRNALWVWNSISQYIANSSAMRYLNLAMWIIGLLTLVTGIVGVSNIMFVSVRERTHEIGVRRAIGAKPRSILTQILAESVSITALFGYIGLFCGMMILQVVDMVLKSNDFVNPTVDISIALQVTVALIIAGALAGLFPALKALKVKPVEALRDE